MDSQYFNKEAAERELICLKHELKEVKKYKCDLKDRISKLKSELESFDKLVELES